MAIPKIKEQDIMDALKYVIAVAAHIGNVIAIMMGM